MRHRRTLSPGAKTVPLQSLEYTLSPEGNHPQTCVKREAGEARDAPWRGNPLYKNPEPCSENWTYKP